MQRNLGIVITKMSYVLLGEPKQLDIGAAANGLRSLAVSREQRNLAKQLAGAQHMLDLLDDQLALDDEVEPVSLVAAPKYNMAGVKPGPAHERPEALDGQTGFGVSFNTPPQTDQFECPPAVHRQQEKMKEENRIYVAKKAIDHKADIAADGDGAQGHHRSHAKGGEDEERRQISDFCDPGHDFTESRIGLPRQRLLGAIALVDVAIGECPSVVARMQRPLVRFSRAAGCRKRCRRRVDGMGEHHPSKQ